MNLGGIPLEKLAIWGVVGFVGLAAFNELTGRKAYFGGFTRDQYVPGAPVGPYLSYQGRTIRDSGSQNFNCVGCTPGQDGRGFICLLCNPSGGGGVTTYPVDTTAVVPVREHRRRDQDQDQGVQHRQHQGGRQQGGQGPGGPGGHGPGGGGQMGPGGRGPGGGGGQMGPGGGRGPGGGFPQASNRMPGGGQQGPPWMQQGGGGQWGPPGGFATSTKKQPPTTYHPSDQDISNVIKQHHIGNPSKDTYDVTYRPHNRTSGDLDIVDISHHPVHHTHPSHGPSMSQLEQMMMEMMMLQGGPPQDTGGGMAPIMTMGPGGPGGMMPNMMDGGDGYGGMGGDYGGSGGGMGE